MADLRARGGLKSTEVPSGIAGSDVIAVFRMPEAGPIYSEDRHRTIERDERADLVLERYSLRRDGLCGFAADGAVRLTISAMTLDSSSRDDSSRTMVIVFHRKAECTSG